jgi:hypothetical protein
MRKALGVVLVAGVVAVAGLSAQGSAGKPTSIIIIGCLQSSGQNAFTLKERRSGRTYQIVADRDTIGWHVGHELEIHGSVEVTADALRVKPDQVIFVATKCLPPSEPSGR